MAKLTKSKTPLKDMFDAFSVLCYPKGMTPDQYNHVRDAFFAGASAMFSSVSSVSEKLSENEAVEYMNRIQAEISGFGQYLDRKALRSK